MTHKDSVKAKQPNRCGTCTFWKTDPGCTRRGKCHCEWDGKFLTRFDDDGRFCPMWEQATALPPLKAISVLQPWASALLGPKDVENRSWALPTQYNGQPIALHASKRRDPAEYAAFDNLWMKNGMPHDQVLDIHFGCIIGVIWFERSYFRYPDSPWWNGEGHAWKKERVIALSEPIPCKGALGIWQLPADVYAAVRAQLGKANPCLPEEYRDAGQQTAEEFRRLHLGEWLPDENAGTPDPHLRKGGCQ